MNLGPVQVLKEYPGISKIVQSEALDPKFMGHPISNWHKAKIKGNMLNSNTFNLLFYCWLSGSFPKKIVFQRNV